MIKSFFHFLGSIQLAIALIGVAALSVIAGTFIESSTGSHLIAAHWTYSHPFFQILLSLFFINILISAMRRWPFKRKHIPFLITHLGLLMVISGTMIKNRFGLQGQMAVWEGSGSQSVLIPHSYALAIDRRDRSSEKMEKEIISLSSFRPSIFFPFYFPELKFKLIGFAPHVKGAFETWIKEDKLYVSGVPPFPLSLWDPPLPFPAGTIHLKAVGDALHPILFQAIKTDHLPEAIKRSYLHDLFLKIEDKGKREPLVIPLQEALEKPFGDGFFSAELHLEPPELLLKWDNGIERETATLPLHGAEALRLKTDLLPSRFTLDLFRTRSTICFLQGDKSLSLLAYDRCGRVHQENFDPDNLTSLLSYDLGFGGYGVQASIPLSSMNREDLEKRDARLFSQELQEILASNPSLSPPLSLLKISSEKANRDFAEILTLYLSEWKKKSELKFSTFDPSLEMVLNNLEWGTIPKKDLQALLWTHQLFNNIEDELKSGATFEAALKKNRWPLPSDESEEHPLNQLAQQVYQLTGYLPEKELPPHLNGADHASLLHAYFRIYGIDDQLLIPQKPHKNEEELILETSLIHRIAPIDLPPKMEDYRPGIVLETEQGGDKETIALAFDPTASGMKWPLLSGKYLVRFQPEVKEIPYRIRLRQARQIPYPQSAQIFSYECDLLISEKEKPAIEQTLSMNHVYETWDGYRFYLSGVGTSSDSSLKRIHLAVNYDPAKYFLTYPGALLVFTGIILLFWIFPYRKNQ